MATNDLHFAVCVGIDRYPGFPGKDLSSARTDAERVRDWLIADNGGGLPAGNVELITASPAEAWDDWSWARPKQFEISSALNRFNDRILAHLTAHPEDRSQSRVYIYAAGHGIGPPDAECAVLMADAKRGMFGYAIELSRYRQWYLDCGLVGELVILADCCREVLDARPNGFGVPFDECRLAPGETIHYTGYAARLGGEAWEPQSVAERDKARGFFTDALLKGLAGGAVDDDGAVTTNTLAWYVKEAVRQATEGLASVPQKTESLADPASPIVMSHPAGPRPTYAVTILGPAGYSGELVLRGSRLDVEQRWSSADGPWHLQLPDGRRYGVDLADAPEADGTAPVGFSVAGVARDVRL